MEIVQQGCSKLFINVLIIYPKKKILFQWFLVQTIKVDEKY